MAEYVDLNLAQDPDEVENFVYTYIQDFYSDWEPREGQLEVVLTEAISELISQLRDLINNAPPSIFQYFGGLINILPLDAKPAVGTVTIVANDLLGHVIPSGTEMYLDVDESTRVAFETVGDATIVVGSNSVTGVVIRALEEGTDANDLSGSPILADILDFISSVTITLPTSGGEEEELLPDYLDRLSDRLQLLADRPVLSDDVATYIRTAITGISRAVAFDNTQMVAGSPVTGVTKAVTFAAVQEDGTAATTGMRDAALALLNASREVGFIFNATDPTYSPIDVVATVVADGRVDAISLQANVLAAIAQFLSPALFGQPELGEEREWVNTTKVYYNELMTAISNVEGVARVNILQLAIHGNSLTSGDISLPGLAPLTTVGPTQTVTVI